MITDTLGAGKTGAADAASAKSVLPGRAGGEASNGFEEALTDVEEGSPPQQAGSAGEEGDELASENLPMARPATTRSIIDIRPEALRRHAEAEEFQPETARTAVESDKHLSGADKRLRDALQAAKAVLSKPGDVHKDDRVSSSPNSDELAELDQSVLGADDAKILDVLSLLNTGDPKAGELQALIQKNTAPQAVRRGKDGDERQRDAGAVATDGPRQFSLSTHADHAQPADIETETEVPGTRQFRFNSARNEGQSVDMVLGGRERGAVEFRQSSAAGVENVTVLDSRRFLGLAPNSNGANLTALLSGDTEWSAAMQPDAPLSNIAAQPGTGSVVNTLKLQMNPFDLGSVTAMLRLQGDELHVHLTVETRAAYRQLSDDSSGMLDALRSQGFSVDQVTISIAPTADTDTTRNQPQSGQQQAAAQGGQGDAAGREQGRASGGKSEGAHDQASEDIQLAPDAARSGQLYL